jgi:hypothetical protein
VRIRIGGGAAGYRSAPVLFKSLPECYRRGSARL